MNLETKIDSRNSAADADLRQIRRLVEDWAVLRDAGDWDGFARVWHEDGWMTATWFQGRYRDFIAASRDGFDNGVQISHFLGGFTCEVRERRAVAQTKMKIEQRAEVHGAEVDVTCSGRFYDFLERRNNRWGIVRRQPIYERDRLDPVDPGARLALDVALLRVYPPGYRHLAYVQREIGYRVLNDLPGLRGAAVEVLYAEGRAWLNGSTEPGEALRD